MLEAQEDGSWCENAFPHVQNKELGDTPVRRKAPLPREKCLPVDSSSPCKTSCEKRQRSWWTGGLDAEDTLTGNSNDKLFPQNPHTFLGSMEPSDP